MSFASWCVIALTPVAMTGFAGALGGQIGALAVVLIIFWGTVNLGRERRSQTAAGNKKG